MFDLGSYWPASDNFAGGGGGYTESLACRQFLVNSLQICSRYIEDVHEEFLC